MTQKQFAIRRTEVFVFFYYTNGLNICAGATIGAHMQDAM